MRKSISITLISIFAVATIVLGMLYYHNNNDKTAQISELEATVKSKDAQIDTLKTDIAEKANQIEGLITDVEGRDAEIGALSADITEKLGQIEELNSTVSDKNSQIEVLTADTANKAVQIEGLTADIIDRDAQIEALTTDVTMQTTQIEGLNADVAERDAQIAVLSADATDKASQIESLNADVATRDIQIEENIAIIAQKDTEVNNLAADNNDLSSQIEALTVDVANKTAEIESLTADVQEKETLINGLNEDLAYRNTRIEELTVEVAEKNIQTEVLLADVANKNTQIETLSSDNTEKACKIEELNTEIEEKNNQINTLTLDLAAKVDEIDLLNTEIDSKNAQIEKLNDGVLGLAAKVTELGRDIEQKAKTLAIAGADYLDIALKYYTGMESVPQDIEQAKTYFTLAAECGNQDAYRYLGDLFYLREYDYKQAFVWYKKAAAAGDSDAAFLIAEMYKRGLGTTQDYKAAIEYYYQSAEKGNAEAYYNLGNMYYNALGTERDYEKALDYYIKAVDLGNLDATILAANMFEKGIGTDVDQQKALEYYRIAADLGNAEAASRVGKALMQEEKYEEAVAYFTIAAENGDVDIAATLGLIYELGVYVQQDYQQALKYRIIAADLGHVYSSYKVGEMYFYGTGTDLDYAQAYKYSKKAADLGNADAAFRTGYLLANGLGTEKDGQAALEYYLISAEAGSSTAYNNIGVLYDNGNGVQQDYHKAVEYYQKAADLNDYYAYSNLSIYYEYGYGVDKNVWTALVYYEKAVKLGFEENQTRRERIIEKLKEESLVLGNYEQDGNENNGGEKIEWIVLDVKEDKALLISRYALDCMKYNTSTIDVTWEKSSLRDWLNNTFYNIAFSTDEQNAIMLTEVENGIDQGYSGYNTIGGNNTFDHVFLLSYSETWEYFESNESRECIPTDYANSQGAIANNNTKLDGKSTCWWWLRSPGSNQSNAIVVMNDGSRTSRNTIFTGIVVRPALWIDIGYLSEKAFQPLESRINSLTTQTDEPAGNSQSVNVVCLDENWDTISFYSQICAAGITTIIAQPIDGYDIDYNYQTAYDVTVTADDASMTNIEFHYVRQINAVDVNVTCVDETGTVIDSFAQACGAGTTTIAAQPIDGYDINSSYQTSYDVIVTADGASISEIQFHYIRKIDTTAVRKSTFEDIHQNDWFYDAVKFAYETGMMKPISERRFGVIEDTSIGEMCDVYCSMLGVASGAEESIALLAQYGVLTPDTTADEKLIREDLIIMSYYFCALVGIEPGETQLGEYPDAAEADPDLAGILGWMLENGLMAAHDGELRLSENANRADAAQLLVTLYKMIFG